MRSLAGMILVLYGAWNLFFMLMMATSIDPQLQGSAWWAEYLGRLFSPEGLLFLTFSLTLMLTGFFLSGNSPRRRSGFHDTNPKGTARTTGGITPPAQFYDSEDPPAFKRA